MTQTEDLMLPNTLYAALGFAGLVLIVVLMVLTKWRQMVFGMVSLWIGSDQGTKQIYGKIGDYLRSKESELEEHKLDEDAHESMRIKSADAFQGHFDKLENLVLASRAAQEEELRDFKTEVVGSVLSLSNRMADMLERQLEKTYK